MLQIFIHVLMLFFPICLIVLGFLLFKQKGLVKELGICWMILGIVSAIVTLIFVIKVRKIEYLVGALILQVIVFLLGTILFQIKIIRSNKIL